MWPLKFAEPSAALRWADRYLSAPYQPSQAGAIIRRHVERTDSPAVDHHGERITGDRLSDLAETISVCLAACDPPGQVIYRHVHGQHRRTEEIALQLLLVVGDEVGDVLGRRRALAMALIVIEGYRCECQGRGGLIYRQMAHELGVSRSVFYKKLRETVDEMRYHLGEWVRRTEQSFYDELKVRKIM